MVDPMTVEEILEEWAAQHGSRVYPEEWAFIADMRKARAAGVGYGWMKQIIEWEWRANDPTGAILSDE